MSADPRAVARSFRFTLVAVAAHAAIIAAQSTVIPVETVSWLTSDSVTRTVTLDLAVTRPGGSSSALINGERAGGVQVIVPINWTVVWDWRSVDSSATHSLVVMAEREKLPLEGGRPVFDNAMTKSLADGLPAGQTDHTTFVADQAGWYWLLCGVPGHAIAGEYIGLRVDPDAKSGSVRVGKR
jgi:hypothetical protein